MQREPAMDHSGFNRLSIFIGAGASGHELRTDLAYRRAPVVGFDRTRQLKQFPLGCLGRGARAILKFHLPFFGRYARTICRTIKITTATRDTSGRPALTASMIIDGRSNLNMTNSVVPKARSGKLTLKAIADRKFGNLAMIQKLNHRGYYVMATRQTAYPPSWRWRIVRRGEPMGVQIEGGGFTTYDAARLAGKRSGART